MLWEVLGMKNEITEDIEKFLMGGKASFTILQEPDTEYKYELTRSDDGNLLFVKAQMEGESKLVYQGYINRSTKIFKVGKNGAKNFNQKAIKGLMWVLNRANDLPKEVHIIHHGVCSVCGRSLSDTKSLICGIGPVCRQRLDKIGYKY